MKTIVAFHTGRGGRFYNPGHTTFIGCRKISDFTDDLFLSYENEKEVYGKIKGRENLENLDYDATAGNEAAFTEFERRTKLKFGKLIYTDFNGKPVGLTPEEAEIGVGCIDIDGDYNRTVAMYLEDCSEDDIRLIAASGYFIREQIIEEYNRIKGL